MSTQTEPLSSWLRQIPGELYNLDEKPLLGFPPEFPWASFSQELANSLQAKDLTIAPGDLQWRSEKELFQGLGDQLKTLAISVGPLSGPIWWVMPEQSLSRLMHLLLNKGSKVFAETIDESFFKAFYQFFAAEVINSFEKIDFDKKLVPTVLREATLPAEACLGLDISITIDQETIYGRLLLSQTFRKSWMQRYTQQQNSLILSSPIADALDVIVHIEAGKINLKPSEWKQILPGDFVVLDSCSLDPNEDKGRVMLVIHGTPFFRAKIKQGSLKILEHPLYHEVDTAMGTPPKNPDHDDEEAFDDSDLNDADFDLDDDEHTMAGETDLDISDDDLDDNHLSETEELKKTKPAEAAAKPTQAATTVSNTPLSVDEIPLNVVIEVGRIQMSVKKLLELQPGNMLDLDIHPEAGIDMVVNGKRIARGELLKIGDSLGIRVLELS